MKNFCAVVILTLISVLPAYAGKWSTGTTAPATCTVGDSWTDTNGTADNRFYTCTSANTWTLNSNQTAIDAKANKAGSVMLWSEYGGGASFDTTSPQVSYNGAFYKCITPYTKTAGEYPDTQTEYFEEVAGAGGGGDIEGVSAGTGLSGGGSSGAVTLSADTSYLQRRVLSTCSSGSSIREIDEDGVVTCESDDVGSGSIPSGTVNGQVLLWATDQWVASTAPWLTTAVFSVENSWSATQNFNAGLSATGLEITVSNLSDIKFGADNWLDDTKTAGHINYLWSSKYIFDQLALKSDATHNHAGVYEPADANLIKVSEIDSLAEFEALLGWSPGGGGSFTFDTFPEYEDSAHTSGLAINATTLAVYSATASKWLTVGLTDTLGPTPVTQTLTITPVDFTGADKFTYSATDYIAEQVITGLTADASFTVSPDTGRSITCAGVGVTDNTGGSYTANTDTENVVATCTSSAVVVEFCGGSDLFCTSWETGTDALNTGATGNEDVFTSQTGTVTRAAYDFRGSYGVTAGAVPSYVEKDLGSDILVINTETFFEIDSESMAAGNSAILLALRSSAGTNLLVVNIVEDATPADTTVQLKVTGWLSSALGVVGSTPNIQLDTRYSISTIYNTTSDTISWSLKNEGGTELATGSDVMTANNTIRVARVGAQVSTIIPKIGAFKIW